MLGGNHQFTFSCDPNREKPFSFASLPSTKKVEAPVFTFGATKEPIPFYPTASAAPSQNVVSGSFSQPHASAKSQEKVNPWTNSLKSGDWSIWSEYERKGVLGTGAYGRVYLASDRVTNQLVAIKKTIMPEEDGAFLNPTTLREITILRKLNGHPNIVRYALLCRYAG